MLLKTDWTNWMSLNYVGSVTGTDTVVGTHTSARWHVEIADHGVTQELKSHMALQVKSGIFPVQWQCRFRTYSISFWKVKEFFFIFMFNMARTTRSWTSCSAVWRLPREVCCPTSRQSFCPKRPRANQPSKETPLHQNSRKKKGHLKQCLTT